MAQDVTEKVDTPESIYLVSYPKIVFLYPTFIAALICGIYMAVSGDMARSDAAVVGLVFLGVMAVNLVVLGFDFPRGTSLTIFFLGAALIFGALLLFRFNPDLLPAISEQLRKIEPRANATFYFLIAALLGVIYLFVLLVVRFDYWEVRPNELLHHHGMLSDLKRYSAPHLRIDKEINDVFEYILLQSGRLILHPSQERRAIVLENVFFISRKERELTRMLGALQVQVRTDKDP